jgi:hypothetical protein
MRNSLVFRLWRDIPAFSVLNIDLSSLGIDAPSPDYTLRVISRTAFGSKLDGVTRIFVSKTLGPQAVRRKVIITIGFDPRRNLMDCRLLTNLIIGKARRWEE